MEYWGGGEIVSGSERVASLRPKHCPSNEAILEHSDRFCAAVKVPNPLSTVYSSRSIVQYPSTPTLQFSNTPTQFVSHREALT